MGISFDIMAAFKKFFFLVLLVFWGGAFVFLLLSAGLLALVCQAVVPYHNAFIYIRQ